MEGSRFCEVNSAYISGLVGMLDKLFVGFGGKLCFTFNNIHLYMIHY